MTTYDEFLTTAAVPRECLLPTPESLYRMCDVDFMVEALRDDLMVMLYGMEHFGVEGDVDRLNRLAQHLGADAIVETDPDARQASVRALKTAYGFAASRYIVEEADRFVKANAKQLLICLLCPTATDQLLRGLPRYDQDFADYLRDGPYQYEIFRYFEEQAGTADFEVRSLLPAFQACRQFPLVFESDPHWNADGHQFVAKTVATLLVDDLEILGKSGP